MRNVRLYSILLLTKGSFPRNTVSDRGGFQCEKAIQFLKDTYVPITKIEYTG